VRYIRVVRWRGHFLAILLGIGALFALGSVGAYAADARSACATADALLDAGDLEGAGTVYRQLTDPCGAAGLEVIAQRQQAARAIATDAQLLLGGADPTRFEQAAPLVELALALDPENLIAARARTALPAPSEPALCEAAAARLSSGEIDTADAMYTEAAKFEATKKCGESGQARVAQIRAESFPSRLAGAVTGSLVPWLEIAAIVIALILAISVIWSSNLRDPLRPTGRSARFARPLGYGAFAASAVAVITLLIGALGRERYSVAILGRSLEWALGHQAWMGAFIVISAAVGAALLSWEQSDRRRLAFTVATGSTDLDVADLTAVIASEFSALAGGTPKGVERVPAPELSESPVATVLELSPNAVVAAAISIWKALTPGIDLTVATHIHVPKVGGPIAVVTLSRGRRELGRQVIDAARFGGDDLEDTRDIATAVAAWVLMQIRPAITDQVRLYGAQRWASVALTAMAGHRPQGEPAHRLLTRAVGADPEYLLARFGLVKSRLRDSELADDAYVDSWREFLTKLPSEYANLPLGWRAKYSFGAALANRAQLAVVNGAPDQADRTAKALKEIDSLIALLTPWQDHDGPIHGRRAPALAAGQSLTDRDLALRLLYLAREGRDAVSVSHAVATASTGGDPLAEAQRILEQPARAGAWARYNRACAFGVVYSYTIGLSEPDGDPKWLTESLDCLQVAFEEPNLVGHAKSDPSLRHVVASTEYLRMFPPPPRPSAWHRFTGSIARSWRAVFSTA